MTRGLAFPPALAGRVPTLPRLRFRTLRGRLTVLYAALFGGIMLAVAGVAQFMIDRHAQDGVQAEMLSSGQVYDRLWALRSQSLAGAADVTARDFGFRTAVATEDGPTIASALESLRTRVDVAKALLVTTEGQVTGDAGALAAELRESAGSFGDQREAVVATRDGIYRLVTSPVLAPEEIGRVVFAVRLDGAELKGLQRLSAIPLSATMLRRDPQGRWVAADGSVPPSTALDRLVAAQTGGRTLEALDLPSGRSFALVKPLRGPGGSNQAAILVSYPIAAALAPYRPLQIGIMVIALAGLGIVVIGSRALARGITQPVAALSAAARSLEEGTRTEVAVTDEDELGELSATFNRMSAGIIERENRISHLAFHDTLTGLPNRAFFRQQLDQALTRAPRTGESVAVLCCDLDSFKGVNDALGHPVGDGLLRGVGAILTQLAPDGIVSRLGGDEFAIILTTPGGGADRARALAKAITERLREPVMAGDHKVATSTSLGVAVGPGDGVDADVLLKNADLALYRAKEDGRSCYRFFEPELDAAARRRHQIELDLREALAEGQFHLNYQPIFDLKQDRVSGFEALLRWSHPTRGLVPPTEFIPVAEETGLIFSIGEWVLREACRQAARWPNGVRVAVNVSPLQFRNPGFSAMVMQALTVSGLEPKRLEIEITESVFIDGETGVLQILHSLRNLGIRVALDDFGTGYSSLSYLRSFPFDKIKIDRSFVTPVADDPSAAAIVRAIVDLASALNMETTAEGVEDNDQLARLRGQGCGSIQGYYFSRPVASDAVVDLISRVPRAA